MQTTSRVLVIVTVAACFANATNAQSDLQPALATTMKIQTSHFGTTPQGDEVSRYKLTNSHGHWVTLMNWGATLMEVQVPDRKGNLENVNFCFDSLEPYMEAHPYFGSTVGRFCNRIGNGKFSIQGKEHQVTLNHGEHHLHGGKKSFTFQYWSGESYQTDDHIGVRFQLTSPDGQEGFPGTVDATVDYSWNDANELKIVFNATTDAPTHVNLTNHSYWNLAGAGNGTARGHVATIEADHSLDVDEDLIPTGKLSSVAGSALDFRKATRIGDRVDELSSTKGYDHCYVVRGEPGTLRAAARVVEPASGRTLEIETTQPGVQLYTGNHLPGDESSAGGGSHDAFCLETQHYPDAPNHESFPSTLLMPDEKMQEVTVHRLGVEGLGN